ncbi:MAG: Crp/Fnr family transcriptional regulator [Tissierellales bacterium]
MHTATLPNTVYDALAKNVQLFKDIEPGEIRKMIGCLGAKSVYYKKNEILLLTHDRLESIGLVLEGSVLVTTEDFMGMRSILSVVSQYGIFAETFVCANISKSPVTITAAENSTIMWLKFPGMLKTCEKSCDFHTKLIENMMNQLAERNYQLHQKLEILSQRSLRDRILAYLHNHKLQNSSTSFSIPLSRNELADYLNVDRAALSRELSKMKDQGMIDYNMNRFKILY